MKKIHRKDSIAIIILALIILSDIIAKRYNYSTVVEIAIGVVCLCALSSHFDIVKNEYRKNKKEMEEKRIYEQNKKLHKNHFAIHEAGHAIISAVLIPDLEIKEISIISKGSSKGRVSFFDEAKVIWTKEDYLGLLTRAYGGRAAEEVILEKIATGSQMDLENASELAFQMINVYAMGKSLSSLTSYPEYNKELIRMNMNQVEELCQNAYKKAKTVISQNKDSVLKLAKLIEEKEELKAEEIKKFMLDNDVYPDP